MEIKKDWQDKAPTLDNLLINYHPLQIPGQDRILRTYTLGGPDSPRDVRFLADIETLEYLLKVARTSKTRRVLIPGAGIRLMVRESNQGHVYETLHLEGGTPVPEVAPTSFNVNVPRADFLRTSPVLKWK